MEIITIQKNIHTSPRKLRLVADMVRKMKPAAALQTLQFTKKSAALPLSGAIKSVLANAKQQHLSENDLVFKKIEINEGVKMRSFRPGSRGRADPYKKRTSQIKIVLSDEQEKVKTQKSKVKITSKKSKIQAIEEDEVGLANLEQQTNRKQGGTAKLAK